MPDERTRLRGRRDGPKLRARNCLPDSGVPGSFGSEPLVRTGSGLAPAIGGPRAAVARVVPLRSACIVKRRLDAQRFSLGHNRQPASRNRLVEAVLGLRPTSRTTSSIRGSGRSSLPVLPVLFKLPGGSRLRPCGMGDDGTGFRKTQRVHLRGIRFLRSRVSRCVAGHVAKVLRPGQRNSRNLGAFFGRSEQ